MVRNPSDRPRHRLRSASLEISFDDEAAFKKAFNSPEGKAMLKDDLRLFDRSMKPAYVGGVVEEHVML